MVAALAVVATVLVAFISAGANREAQTLSIRGQRAISDRQELRAVLDDAFAKLDDAALSHRELFVLWSNHRRPASHSSYSAAAQKWFGANTARLRVVLRLGRNSPVSREMRDVTRTMRAISSDVLLSYDENTFRRASANYHKLNPLMAAFLDAARREVGVNRSP